MAKSITAIVRDPETGEGIPGQTVKLRIGPAFSADLYTMTDITGKPGAYEYNGDYVTADYKLWVNGVEDDSFGGDNGKGIVNVDQILKLAGGTMAGNINMDSNRILSLPDPVDNNEPEKKGRVTTLISAALSTVSTALGAYLLKAGGTMTGALLTAGASANAHAINKGEGDGWYIKKAASGTAEQVFSQVNFRLLPYLINDPTHARHPTSRNFVENYCQALLMSLNPSAYQQSANILRLIPSGVQEDNKVYRTMAAIYAKAEDFAASDRHMIIEVHGNGDGATDLNYNLLPVGVAEPYIHLRGMSEDVVIRVAEDTYEGTAGANVISDVIFDNEVEDAVTDFENKIFYHCKFSNTFGSGTPVYNFTGCIFIGCTITTSYTFTTCKGAMYDLALDRWILLGSLQSGSYTVLDSNADLRPRRLQGRQGIDIASAASITLGNGNYFVITGNTTIANISTSGWQDGSVVYLFFTSSLTLDTGGGNLARIGGDLIPAAGQVVSLLLDASTWIILEV